MLALFATEVLKAPEVFLNDFVEQCAFGAAPNVSSIVPRKGSLPVSVMMVPRCESLALLLHEASPVQSMDQECSRIPLYRAACSFEHLIPSTWSIGHVHFCEDFPGTSRPFVIGIYLRPCDQTVAL